MKEKYLSIVNWKRVALPEDVFIERAPSSINIKEEKVNITNYNIDKLVEPEWLFCVPKKLDDYITKEAEKNNFIINDNGKYSRTIELKDNEVLKEDLVFKVRDNEDAVINLDYSTLDQNFKSRVFSKIRIFIGKNSKLTVNRVQRLNDNSYSIFETLASIDQSSNIVFNDFQIGSKYKAVQMEIQLNGKESNALVNPAFLADKSSLSDFSYTMYHRDKHTNSHINGKGIMKEKAQKVFRGNLEFEKGSSKSVGREEENCILFDENINSHSIPALLCGEDDVIGEHAASIGRFDDDKLFYMMTRGFSQEQAKILIAKSVFNDVLMDIDNDLIKENINNELERRIGGL